VTGGAGSALVRQHRLQVVVAAVVGAQVCKRQQACLGHSSVFGQVSPAQNVHTGNENNNRSLPSGKEKGSNVVSFGPPGFAAFWVGDRMEKVNSGLETINSHHTLKQNHHKPQSDHRKKYN